MASTTITTMLHKMDEKKVTVGVDGSVYRYHPHFRSLMMEKIKELCDPSIEVSYTIILNYIPRKTYMVQHLHKLHHCSLSLVKKKVAS